MKFYRYLLFFCPVVCVVAQTPPPASRPATPIPPPPPGVNPVGAPKVNPDGSVTYTMPMPPAVAQVPPDKVVLQVGDTTVTAAQFDLIVDGLPDQYKSFVKGPGRKQFADQLAKVLVLAQEGHRRKLDEKPEFKLQAMVQQNNVLANMAGAAISSELKLDDATLKAYYDAHKSEYEFMRARHILVRFTGSTVPVKPGSPDLSEEAALAKALELQKRLKAGEDFAKLATAESDDTGSAVMGGDLNEFGHGRMVPSFDEAAFKLQAGQTSDPVKSQFGYHIIKVDSRSTKTFEEEKANIDKKLRPAEAQKAVDAALVNAKVVYDPVFFGLEKQ